MTNWRHLGIWLVASLVIAGASLERASAGQKPPLQLCEALAEAGNYAEKMIVVEGSYMRVFHGAILSAPGCTAVERPEANLKMSPAFHAKKPDLALMNKRASKGEAVHVVLMGTLRVAKVGHCFGQACEPYEIEVVQLLRAYPGRGAPGKGK